MGFGKGKPRSKPTYESWSGEVEVTGYNPAYESLLLKADGEESWAKMDTGDASDSLERGDVATVKLTRKEGTKSWYIKEVSGVEKTEAEPASAKSTSTKSTKKESSYETGQAHGNYRNIIGAFIAQMAVGQGYPTIDQLYAFNEALKIAEDNYFNGTVIEIQDQTTEKAEETQGDSNVEKLKENPETQQEPEPKPAKKKAASVPKGVKFGG